VPTCVFGQVFAVPQHQHGPLPAGEPGQRLPDQRPERLPVRDVLVRRALGQRGRRGLPPAGTPPGPVRVDHDAPQVGVRVRAGVEPRPRPLQLDQAGLDDILRRVPVAREQHRHPQMVIAPLADISHVGERYFTRMTVIYRGNRSYRADGKLYQLSQTSTFPLWQSEGHPA
jgi:hypothetical protein